MFSDDAGPLEVALVGYNNDRLRVRHFVADCVQQVRGFLIWSSIGDGVDDDITVHVIFSPCVQFLQRTCQWFWPVFHMILINVSKRLLLLGKKRVYKHSLLNVCYPTFTNVRKKISNQTRLYYKRFFKKFYWNVYYIYGYLSYRPANWQKFHKNTANCP